MPKTLRVTAPYVTLKVVDRMGGGYIVSGFYDGAVVADVEDASADHHLAAGLAVPAGDDPEPAAHPEIPAEPPAPPAEEPAGNASTDEWVAYAKSKGAKDEDLVDADGKPLGQRALREKFGAAAS
jgi:hypothetical protein